MASQEIDDFTELVEGPALADLFVVVDASDTTDSPQGTTKRIKVQYGLGSQVNAQTGTTYTYLTTDFRKLVTHTNASPIAGTLPQASATFPAGWSMFVQNRGAGALTITPTTSTIDGGATLVLNQNEGALVVSDGTNYFSMRGKATGGVGGVGDVVGPASATDNALVRFDSTTGKLIQNSTVTLDDTGAITVPEMAAPATPASGKVAVYAKADGKLYIKDDTGAETDLTGAGAPSIAPLVIEGANSVAQRNSTNNQDFNVYETFIDASNYSRLRVASNGSTGFEIFSEKLGSPTLRVLRLSVGGTNLISFGSSTVNPTNAAIALGGTSNRWLTIDGVDIRASSSLQFGVAGKIAQTGGNGVLTITDTSNNPGTWSGLAQTPSQFTANQDNFAMSKGYMQRWSSDASRDVTGISTSQIAGQVHLIINVGSNDIVLKHESASSTAGNRFLNSTGADITLAANQAAEIIYDSTTARWRVFKRN